MKTSTGAAPGHSVQLFDSVASRAAGISTYLMQGLRHGNSVLVVATPANWEATKKLLECEGIDIDKAIATGTLTVLDAAETLAKFMRGNTPDPAKLEDVLGALVARLAQRPGRLHIYGEMVDVLAESGNYRGAHRLEELWNSMADRTPFDLFCGYTSAHFGDHRSTAALRAICDAHAHVHSTAADELGTFLTAQAKKAPVEDQTLPWRFTPGNSPSQPQ
jgi:hypothetical protein